MLLNYKIITPPAAEPVSLTLAKQHLRVDFDDDDQLIETYITAARQLAEKITHRAFFDQTIQLTLDHFPYLAGSTVGPSNDHSPWGTDFWNRWAIQLPRPACVGVQSITYKDIAGNTVTLDPSTYAVDITSEPARIVPAPGLAWPYDTQYVPGSVTVTYVAGSYGDGVDTNDCPQTIVLAILMLVAHFYANRANTSQGMTVSQVPMAVDALLDSEKFEWFSYA